MLSRLLALISVPLLVESVLRLLWLVAGRKVAKATPRQFDLHEPPSVQIVVPAHNEQAVIAETVSRLIQQTYPPDHVQVIVLADNCTDSTAQLARQAGAQAFERCDPMNVGKGAALHWWLGQPQSATADLIAVFDADSQVNPDFLVQAIARLTPSVDAVQGFIEPLAEAGSIGVLSGYSELLAQSIDDCGRTALGWSVPLRGTGMIFSSPVLRSLLPQIVSQSEDMELSILLAAQGGQVAFAPHARLLDPKPVNQKQAQNQRTRWSRGHWHAIRSHPMATLTALLLRGLGSFALALSLLLRPKILYLTIRVALWLFYVLRFTFAFFGLLSKPKSILLSVALSVALVIEAGYYLAGLSRVEQPRIYATALRQAPLYGWVWLRSFLQSRQHRATWLHARHAEPEA